MSGGRLSSIPDACVSAGRLSSISYGVCRIVGYLICCSCVSTGRLSPISWECASAGWLLSGYVRMSVDPFLHMKQRHAIN